jgi:hypothetical protein
VKRHSILRDVWPWDEATRRGAYGAGAASLGKSDGINAVCECGLHASPPPPLALRVAAAQPRLAVSVVLTWFAKRLSEAPQRLLRRLGAAEARPVVPFSTGARSVSTPIERPREDSKQGMTGQDIPGSSGCALWISARSRPAQCRIAAAGARRCSRTCRGGCWSSTPSSSCRGVPCRRTWPGVARALAGCGACRPVW